MNLYPPVDAFRRQFVTAARWASQCLKSIPVNFGAMLRSAAVALVVCCACGCRDDSTPGVNRPQETKMKALTVSKLHNGVESLVGTITFDDSNNGTLVTEGDQDEAQRLRQIWDEASRRESLPMQKAERKEVNGEKVTKYTSTNVSKSDDRYPAAVWSFLERQHGYLVDKKE